MNDLTSDAAMFLCFMLEMQFEDELEMRERTLGVDQKPIRLVGVNLSSSSIGGAQLWNRHRQPITTITLLSNIGPSTMNINEFFYSALIR